MTAVFLKNTFVTHKAAPVVVFLDFLDVGLREISTNTFVAEDEGTS